MYYRIKLKQMLKAIVQYLGAVVIRTLILTIIGVLTCFIIGVKTQKSMYTVMEYVGILVLMVGSFSFGGGRLYSNMQTNVNTFMIGTDKYRAYDKKPWENTYIFGIYTCLSGLLLLIIPVIKYYYF